MQTKILSEITKLYPASEDSLRDLFDSNEAFHSLCVDLYDCRKMIKELEKEKTINYKLLEEYKELFNELREELNSIIHEMFED